MGRGTAERQLGGGGALQRWLAPPPSNLRSTVALPTPAAQRGVKLRGADYLTKVRQMNTALVSQVRSFNRRVTQTIGALHDDYLGRDRPLGESRLLFEIGRHGATAAELRARLG